MYRLILSNQTFKGHPEFEGELSYKEADAFVKSIYAEIKQKFGYELKRKKHGDHILIGISDIESESIAQELVDLINMKYDIDFDSDDRVVWCGDQYRGGWYIEGYIYFVSNARIGKYSLPDRQSAYEIMRALKSKFDVRALIHKGTTKYVTIQVRYLSQINSEDIVRYLDRFDSILDIRVYQEGIQIDVERD